ncbi:energy transducer TonB [Hoylesella loescheii]|uniref:energy transducer TonB n=1 Tax=Hoylesella loescheii TaxID=840 RepID=UPI00248E3D57|nr:energy transducer TonB [Hoylesella loescheii]
MNKIRTVILLILAFASVAAIAQTTNDNITLIVTGNGPTKESATDNALRSAIRQTYELLVSADTSLLRNEMVKNEIISTHLKNIKNYKHIVFLDDVNGEKQVTLLVTVSVPNLISYAKSQGATTEFSGSTFARGMKMRDLLKANELQALFVLKEQIRRIIPLCMDKQIFVEEPKMMPAYRENHVFNMNFSYGVEQYFDTYNRGWNVAKPTFQRIASWGNRQDSYLMTLRVQFRQTKYFNLLRNIIKKTLNSLCISKDEVDRYSQLNIPFSERDYSFSEKDSLGEVSHEESVSCVFRNSSKELGKWEMEVVEILNNEIFNFLIKDNTGIISEIYSTDALILKSRNWTYKNFKHLVCNIETGFSEETADQRDALLEGTGLFSPYVALHYINPLIVEWQGTPTIELLFPIRKTDIDKYSEFYIVRKDERVANINIDFFDDEETENTEGKDEEEIHDIVEQYPTFKGDVYKWLSDNVQYPDSAIKSGIQGRVIIRFAVRKDGSVTDAKVARSVDPILDNEALRVIKSMPKWKPGYINGIPVSCWYNLPIQFRLQGCRAIR